MHPGYLVDDPEGYHPELLSEARMHVRADEDKLGLWLVSGAERFRRDPELRRALLAAAQHEDTRRSLLLLAAILETPSLADRLLEVLRPELAPRRKQSAAKDSTGQRSSRNGVRNSNRRGTREGSLDKKERG